MVEGDDEENRDASTKLHDASPRLAAREGSSSANAPHTQSGCWGKAPKGQGAGLGWISGGRGGASWSRPHLEEESGGSWASPRLGSRARFPGPLGRRKTPPCEGKRSC